MTDPVQRLAVPAYFHPDDAAEWAALAGSGAALVVANVADGPGLVREEPWAAAFSAVRCAGAHVVGYVDTGYLGLTGQRTRSGSNSIDDWIEQILDDIAEWYALYGDIVTGVFFDQITESADGASVAPIFLRFRQHLRDLDDEAITVMNPGAAVPAVFSLLADVLVTFEGPCEAYLGGACKYSFEPLTWQPGPDQLIWHIVHSTPVHRVHEVVSASKSRGAGLLCVTDGEGSNPYSSLPSEGVQAATGAARGSSEDPHPMFRREHSSRTVRSDSPVGSARIGPDTELISNPTLVRTENTIEASAEFVVPTSSRRVFLASRRRNVRRWWTGSSPQIAADWLIENNHLYEYVGSGTDWNWRPTGDVVFEARGRRARWCLEADLLGIGAETGADAAFHVSAPGHREYSDVAICNRQSV